MQFISSVYDHDSRKNGYKCQLCGKTSLYQSNIQRHMIVKHTAPTNEVCQYCSKVFKYKCYLYEHIRSRKCLSKMVFKAPPQ